MPEGEWLLSGSLVAPLPQRLFVFYAAAIYQSKRKTDLPDPVYVYDAQDKVYRKNTGDGFVLDRSNAVVLAGTGSPTHPGAEVTPEGVHLWYVGIGRSEEEARETAVSIPMDARSTNWLRGIDAFAAVNKGRFSKITSACEESSLPRVAVIDTEREGSVLVQFAGVLLTPGKDGYYEEDEDHFYVCLPKGVSLSQGVKNVTGLSERFLKNNGLSRWSAAVRLSVFLEGADIICGQDVNMDIRAVQELLTAEGLELPDSVTNERMVDTTVMVQLLYERKDAVNLKDAALLTGVIRPGEHFHDAVTDARVTGRIFSKLLSGYRERFAPFPDVPRTLTMGTKDQELLAGLPDLPKVRVPAPSGENAARQATPSADLKACPVCGGTPILRVIGEEGKKRYYVTCPVCRRSTLTGEADQAAGSRRKAANEWNSMQVKSAHSRTRHRRSSRRQG